MEFPLGEKWEREIEGEPAKLGGCKFPLCVCVCVCVSMRVCGRTGHLFTEKAEAAGNGMLGGGRGGEGEGGEREKERSGRTMQARAYHRVE